MTRVSSQSGPPGENGEHKEWFFCYYSHRLHVEDVRRMHLINPAFREPQFITCLSSCPTLPIGSLAGSDLLFSVWNHQMSVLVHRSCNTTSFLAKAYKTKRWERPRQAVRKWSDWGFLGDARALGRSSLTLEAHHSNSFSWISA